MNREIDDTLLLSLRPTTRHSGSGTTIHDVRENIYLDVSFYNIEWIRKYQRTKRKNKTKKKKQNTQTQNENDDENTLAQNSIDIKMHFYKSKIYI